MQNSDTPELEARADWDSIDTFPAAEFREAYNALPKEGRRYVVIACLFLISAAKIIIEGGTVDYTEIRANLPEDVADLLIEHLEREIPELRAGSGTVEGGTSDVL